MPININLFTCFVSPTLFHPLSPNVSSFNTNAFAYIDGVVYWIVFDHSQQRSSILSFDFVGEVFQKIVLPDKMGKGIEFFHTSIGVFERLVSMFHYRQDGKDYYCDIWVLEMETWKMIRTIIFPERGWITWPLGFRATGGVHMVMLGGDFVLYGPEPRQLNPLGIKLHDGYNFFINFVPLYVASSLTYFGFLPELFSL
ncbi:hypothetical protein DVH24_035461 [Malus domestica]|uniref:Uncharacterized protein n=1 Tax=Malus domestica TaxID=3750 RepID=A0A498J7P5_MALDO|nr:hypothetical protein DVH24_035461 [Malus domestica]